MDSDHMKITPQNCKPPLQMHWIRYPQSACARAAESHPPKGCRVHRGHISTTLPHFGEGYVRTTFLILGKIDSRETIYWDPVKNMNVALAQSSNAAEVFALRTPADSVRHRRGHAAPSPHAHPGALHHAIATTRSRRPITFNAQQQDI